MNQIVIIPIKFSHKAIFIYLNSKKFFILITLALIGKNGSTYKKKEGDMKTPKGVYKLGNRTWNCWYYTDYHVGHGWQDVTGAIKR